MEVISNHIMVFECNNNGDVVLPMIKSPSHIYKVGEEILVYDILQNNLDKGEVVIKLRVTDVKHELHKHVDADQYIIVYVEKVE